MVNDAATPAVSVDDAAERRRENRRRRDEVARTLDEIPARRRDLEQRRTSARDAGDVAAMRAVDEQLADLARTEEAAAAARRRLEREAMDAATDDADRRRMRESVQRGELVDEVTAVAPELLALADRIATARASRAPQASTTSLGLGPLAPLYHLEQLAAVLRSPEWQAEVAAVRQHATSARETVSA